MNNSESTHKRWNKYNTISKENTLDVYDLKLRTKVSERVTHKVTKSKEQIYSIVILGDSIVKQISSYELSQ